MCERFLPKELITKWRAEYPADSYIDDNGEVVSRFRSTGTRGAVIQLNLILTY